jgi:hypothetical protein
MMDSRPALECFCADAAKDAPGLARRFHALEKLRTHVDSTVPYAPFEPSCLALRLSAGGDDGLGLLSARVVAPSPPDSLVARAVPSYAIPGYAPKFQVHAGPSCFDGAAPEHTEAILLRHLRVTAEISTDPRGNPRLLSQKCQLSAAGRGAVRVTLPALSPEDMGATISLRGVSLAGRATPCGGLPATVQVGACHDPTPAGRLIAAVGACDALGVAAALAAGCSTNEGSEERTLSGGPPLHLAAFWGRLEVCRVLLAAGADPMTRNFCEATALHAACMGTGYPDVVLLLLKDPRVDPNALAQGVTPFYSIVAAACHVHGYNTPADPDSVIGIFLSDPRIDVNPKPQPWWNYQRVLDDGDSPLHKAARYSAVNVVDALLSHERINVNPINCYGNTPLHVGVISGAAATVKRLLADPRVDVTATNDAGDTALALARRFVGSAYSMSSSDLVALFESRSVTPLPAS